MEIHDSVAERRNLIVMSLAIIVYYWAGGSVVDQKLKLPMVNIEFSEPVVLFIFVWVLFIYFIFRYRVTSKALTDNSIRDEMKSNLAKFSIKEKHHAHLFEQLVEEVPEGTITGLEFNNWFIVYNQQSIGFRGTVRGHNARNMSLQGFYSRWIVFTTLVRGYFNFASVNAYYTPYLLAGIALITLGYNTYLKICTEILEKSC